MSEQEIELQNPDELDELSEDELTELAEALGDDPRLGSGSAPSMKEKQDIMNFFNNVLNRDDTTKTSNLSDEELQSVRLMQRASLIASEVDYTIVARYIKKRAEILLATGLSGRTKGGFFLQLINTSKKMLEAVSGRKAPENTGGRRGWFAKKQ